MKLKITQSMIDQTQEAIKGINQAVLAGNEILAESIVTQWGKAAEAQYNETDKAVTQFHYCEEIVIRCAAEEGKVPLWGQNGSFVLEVEGIRAFVIYDGLKWGTGHFEFHAIELCAPFISETGYQSHFFMGIGATGLTVKEAAEYFFRERMASKGKKIEPTQFLVERVARLNTLSCVQKLSAAAVSSSGKGLQLTLF